MQILKFPHPDLFKVCEPVEMFDFELKHWLDKMWKTMKNSNGIGLAANQVGLNTKMFVLEGPSQERHNIINPEILRKSIVSANLKEGCLSSPGEFLILSERPEWIQTKFQDESGEFKIQVFTGIHSVAFCHEMDHLMGKSHLQSKSIPRSKRLELAKKWGV